MILFLNDWKKYPGAIADTQTKNRSFVRLSAILKAKGIKNYLFPLALHNPSLQGVDPYSPDLTEEQIAAIMVESNENPWYNLREIIRFGAKAGAAPASFEASRANISLIWCYFSHIDYALLMCRQKGKSSTGDALWLLIGALMASGARIRVLTKDEKLRVANVERIKAMRDLLPIFLDPPDKGDLDNTETVTFRRRNNQISFSIARNSLAAADNLGRGMTEENIQIDEVPWLPKIHITLPVVLAAATAIRDIARAAGSFFGTIYTTTAGKLDTDEGAYAYRIIHDGMPFNEVLYDSKSVHDLESMICAGSTTGKTILINGTWSHLQLGKPTNGFVNVSKILNPTD